MSEVRDLLWLPVSAERAFDSPAESLGKLVVPTNLMNSNDRSVELEVVPAYRPKLHGHAEVAVRESGGYEIRHMYDFQTGEHIVIGYSPAEEEGLRIVVEEDQDPKDVFHHPFSYGEAVEPISPWDRALDQLNRLESDDDKEAVLLRFKGRIELLGEEPRARRLVSVIREQHALIAEREAA